MFMICQTVAAVTRCIVRELPARSMNTE